MSFRDNAIFCDFIRIIFRKIRPICSIVIWGSWCLCPLKVNLDAFRLTSTTHGEMGRAFFSDRTNHWRFIWFDAYRLRLFSSGFERVGSPTYWHSVTTNGLFLGTMTQPKTHAGIATITNWKRLDLFLGYGLAYMRLNPWAMQLSLIFVLGR